MARIKFGMMMTDARGKLGGQVFSKTRSGAVVRTKVTPTNPQTTAQALARAIFGTISQEWRALTETERESWRSTAKDFAKTNVFGDQYFSSGKNYFQEINGNLENAGLGRISEPQPFTPPPIVIATSMLVDNTTGEIDIEYDTPAPGGTGRIIYEASPFLSAGKKNFSGSFRKITVTPSTAYPTATVLFEAYVDVFGMPPTGAKFALRVKTVSESGASSTYSTVDAIVFGL